MVTRALPAGDSATVRAVYDAVGPTFLSRLLLPLRRNGADPGDPPADEEARQKQAGMAALGVAVLSSAAQVPDIAASDDFIQLLPLFLSVVRAGGVSPLASLPPEAAGDGTDAAVALDALQCAVAAAAASEEGRRVAAESGALAVAAAALRRAAAADPRRDDLDAALWATQLAAVVLGGPDRTSLIVDNGDAVIGLVSGLARAAALPALLADSEAARAAAALHLDALHALLLILPLPLPEVIDAQEDLERGALQAAWAWHLRLATAVMLRSRAAAVQRHSALALAAAAVGLAGPGWLTAPLGGVRGAAADPGGGPRFYQLVVEILRVEISVLLHDVVAPGAAVPLATASGTAAAQWRPPAPRDGGEEAEAGPGDAEPGPSQVPELEAVLGSDEHSAAMEARIAAKSGTQSAAAAPPAAADESGGDIVAMVDAVQLHDANLWAAGPSESAWERALRSLPPCLALFEAAVEALALDQEDSIEILGDNVAQRALQSLHATADVLLQVIEEGSGDGAAAAVAALRVAVVRALGRFLAEVPDAFAGRVRAALPSLLSVHSAPAGAASPGSPSIASSPVRTVDSMLNTFGEFVERVQSTEEEYDLESGGGGGGGGARGHEGVAFMLPLLLQVTDRRHDAQEGDSLRLWVDALVHGGGLHHLIDFGVAAAEERGAAVTDAAALAPSDALLVVSNVLLQVFDYVEGTEGQRALEFEAADAGWPLIAPLADALAAAQGGELDEDEVPAVVRGAALLAAVLAAVAEEATHPDDAHQAAQALFRRRDGLGMGPVSGANVKKACELVLRGLAVGLAAATAAAARGGVAAAEAAEDLEVLITCAARLKGSCGAFREALAGNAWAREVAASGNGAAPPSLLALLQP